MFTLQIHILETLCIYTQGATVAKIRDMGVVWSNAEINRSLKSLQKDGMVRAFKQGRINVWVIEPRAIRILENIHFALHLKSAD